MQLKSIVNTRQIRHNIDEHATNLFFSLENARYIALYMARPCSVGEAITTKRTFRQVPEFRNVCLSVCCSVCLSVQSCVPVDVNTSRSHIHSRRRHLCIPRLSLQLSSSTSSSLLSRSHRLRLTAQGRSGRHFAAGSPSNSFVKLPARGYVDVSHSGVWSLNNLRSQGTD